MLKTLFRKNVGGLDRAVRVALGIALIAMVFFPPVTAWGWLGVIPLATALFGTCPLYSLIGVDTCPTD
jgi:hypothetical protein